MHTFLTRGNATVAYTLSILAGLTFCCFISTVFLDYRTNARINTVKILVKNMPDYGSSREKHDLGFITFDLETNLTSLFNWNVKQLFLYMTAEYKTAENVLNQVVLWDKIILRGENAALDYKSMHTKYYFWDDGNGLNILSTADTYSRIELSRHYECFQLSDRVDLSTLKQYMNQINL